MLVKITTIEKMPYHSCSLGKFPLTIYWRNAALQKFARKKAAPDAQGRLQCRKWREF